MAILKDMDLCSLDKFKKYKNDWIYPSYICNTSDIASGRRYRRKCATFQAAMKMTLIIGQFFALNPVSGVCESDAFQVRFSFASWRFAFTMLSISGQAVLVFFCILKLFMHIDSSLTSNTSVIFYSTNCLTTILFLRIATKWPGLCQQIAKTEAADPNMDPKLVRNCNISCVAILTLALVEHILSDLNGIATAVDCEPDKNIYETFIVMSFPWIYNFVPYNIFYGLITQFFNLQCTFNWTFSHLFIICVSLYLISRLEQVNKRIVAVKGKYVPTSFWRTMREDYSKVTYLVRMVDDVISGMVFLSFANSLFFICLQLLHTLALVKIIREGVRSTPRCRLEGEDQRPFRGYEQVIYFVYSFIFLVVRWLMVSLIAAKVHSASLQPAKALYDVSSANYCIEVQRFLDQIHGDTVALSGLQFFNVKRGLILTIASTIVTYELVLMQFTGISPTTPSPT